MAGALAPQPAFADSLWTGGAGTHDWGTAGNWSPAAVPTSTGAVTINNGSTFTPVTMTTAGATAASIDLGSTVGAVGALTISGSGVLTTATDGVYTFDIVGDSGSGTLSIVGGGHLYSVGGVVANNDGSSGTVTIAGAGSTWRVENGASTAGTLYVSAGAAPGVVNVSAGGSLVAHTLDIADWETVANGSVTVTGTGSTLYSDGATLVGTQGTGALNVANGASGTITGSLSLGGSGGAGALNVTGGATLSSRLTVIGSSTGSGTAVVSGAGSTWTIAPVSGSTELTVNAGAANSSLTVQNGGSVVMNGASMNVLIGGAAASASQTASLTVDGAGSSFAVSNFGLFAVGAVTGANGALTVSNGGQLTTWKSYLGYSVSGTGGGTGTALVTGAGSTWTVGGADLDIGAYGSGTLTVANGGAVSTTASMVLGGGAGTSATLNIGAAAGSPAAAPGTVTTSYVTLNGGGTSTINFNHTSDAYVFAPHITGTGTINVLAGTTILTAASSLTGTTTIAPGATLELSADGTHWGSLASDIVDNGALVFNWASSFPSAAFPYKNKLTGDGSLVLEGGGTLYVSGDSSGFAGAVQVHSFYLALNNDANSVGKLGASSADIGVSAGDSGVVSLYNTGATLRVSGEIVVGDAGSGWLSVSGPAGGASVTSGSAVLAKQSGSTALVGVVGAGNTWTNAGGLVVGEAGTADLKISNGATLSDASAIIGDAAGSVGTVEVWAGSSGTAGVWTTTGTITIANQSGSTGTLTIGGATTATSPGTVNASGVVFGAGNGVLNFNHTSSNYIFLTPISGPGAVNLEAGATAFAHPYLNTYTGPTTIMSGATLSAINNWVFSEGSDLIIQAGGKLDISGYTNGVGSLAGAGAVTGHDADLLTGVTNASTTFSGVISDDGVGGPLGLWKVGTGTLTLTGDNTYSGGTTISAGTLAVTGSLTSAVTVQTGATLAGSGTVGSVTVAGGGALSGTSGQTLTMASLSLNSGANVNVTLGGDYAAPLFRVVGNLTLAGALNVTAGYPFGAGVYGIFTYGGSLTNNGFTLGTTPAGYTGQIQTSVANEVNLVVASTTTTPTIQFWNGTTTTATGTIVGGAGVWTAGSTTNWTDSAGATSSAWGGDFTVFQSPGATTSGAAVTVDSGAGAVSATGMQFVGTGWSINGAPVTLNGAGGQTTIRVGDGTATGVGYTATIGSTMTGASQLVKTDLGTLILAGANSYSGGTAINAGTLTLAHATSGAIDALGAGAVTFTDAATLDVSVSGTLANAIAINSGVSATIGAQAGQTLTLNGAFAFNGGGGATLHFGSATDTGTVVANMSGGTAAAGGAIAIDGGVLKIGSAFAGAAFLPTSAGLPVTINAAGTVDINGFSASLNNVTTVSTGTITNTGAAATLTSSPATTQTLAGTIAGNLSLAMNGPGTLILTGADLYNGGTTISAGRLQIGNGGTAGSILGNVADNGTLAFNRSDSVTFGGIVSGTGSLVQLGAGTLILTGANTYTGGATISAGALQIGNGGTTGAIVGNVADDGTLAFNRSDSVAFGGVVSGNGSLVQLGAGTLILTGANTYTGGTTVSAGTLQIGNGGTAGAIVGNVVDNGRLAFNRSDNVAFVGAISGTGAVVQFGAGTLTLTGTNSYSGGTFASGGELIVGSNSALGSGALTMIAGTTLGFSAGGLTVANPIVFATAVDPTIDTGSNSETLTGAITGSGALTKLGSGTLTLSGASTYTGATDVKQGTLAVTGSLSSTVTVESGATLAGSGAIGGLTVTSGATLAPGAVTPYSKLTVNGAVSFASGSTFAVNINAAGQNDKLVSTGATTISGGTVQVTAASGTYNPATVYTLVTAQGGVTGTFASLSAPSTLAFLSPSLSYDADDVTLKFTPTVSLASAALTRNQKAVAVAEQTIGSGTVYNALITQAMAAGARAGFDALSGEIHTSAVTAAFEDSRMPREAVLDRLADPFGAPPSSSAGFVASAAPTADPLSGNTMTAWGQAFGTFGHISGDGNAAGLDRTLGGFILGVDQSLDNRYRFGLTAGYTQSGLNVAARSSNATIYSSFLGLYGGANFEALRLRGGALYAFNRFETSRMVGFPGFGDKDGSAYGGGTFQTFAEAGWRLNLANFVRPGFVEPFVGLLAESIHTDSFAENGGAAALLGSSRAYGFGATTLGARYEIALTDALPLTARGLIGWRHVFGDVTPTSALAFASATSTPFTIAGTPIFRDAATIEAGLDLRLNDQASLGLYYSGALGGQGTDNGVKGRFEAQF